MRESDASVQEDAFVPKIGAMTAYRRAESSKAVGCLVYLVVTPFVALSLSLLIAVPLIFVLQGLGVSERFAPIAFPILLIPISLGAIAWGFHEYRGRAAAEVLIYQDGVLAQVGRARRALAFDDVETVRLDPAGLDMACTLIPRTGRALRLPPDIAPYSIVSRPLSNSLIAVLARRLGNRFDAGESVTVRERLPRALRHLARGVAGVVAGCLLILTLLHAIRGIAVVRNGVWLVRQGLVGVTGGVLVDSHGLRHLREEAGARITWDRLTLVHVDELGFLVRSDEGRTFVASPFAEGYLAASAWIAPRIRSRPPRAS